MYTSRRVDTPDASALARAVTRTERGCFSMSARLNFALA